jgi:hypothetical protein
MRLHATRLTAGLLAFVTGTAAASLRPAPTQTTTPTVQTPQTPPAPAVVQTTDTTTVVFAETAKEKGPRVTQQLWIDFPKAGLVHVRAVENFGEQMRIEILDVATDALLHSFPAPTDEQPDAEMKVGNPFLRFRILRTAGLPGPLIFVVAVTPGGSGHGFYASLIGEVGGRLKVLTRESPATDNQGGIHIGDLGGGRGVGLAVWAPICDFNCEGHYSPHRFEVEYYPFDARRGSFIKGRTVRSKGKYGGHGEGALKELRLSYTDLLQDMPDISEYHWL